jgi:hypothetical protein
VKFAGIRTLKGEKKIRSYAYVKEYVCGTGVRKAHWLFVEVDQCMGYTTAWYLITD